MIAEQEQYTCVQITNQPLERAAVEPAFYPAVSSELNHTRLFEFAANAPATLAERHPRLTVAAVSVAVLLVAVIAEIDCLSHSGYFWR